MCLNLFINLLFLTSFIFGASSLDNKLFSADYFTDESGNIYMYVNIIGHVKSPGTYIISENADILSILSQAGGYLPGAKLNEIKIYSKDMDITLINLEDHLSQGTKLNLSIKPNDTIYIKQKNISYIISKTNIINSILQLLNIYLSIEKING